MRKQHLEAQLKALPAKPGVYVFRGEDGRVLYIGKAKSLRPRVRSYFQATPDTRAQIAQLPGRVEDIEVIVTGTEAEALHVEQNLVKRHRPPFNIRLRDDKSFPYIAVTIEDEYPRVMFTRERHRRGVLYFGPYANAKKVRETLDVLNRVFQFRPCEGPKPGRHSGIPCLDYHIERCKAPCVGYVSKEEYGELIDCVIEFLSGETKPVLRELERQMQQAAGEERFEDAARYRNRLYAIRHLAERQAADRRSESRPWATVRPCRSSRSETGSSSTGTGSTSRTWTGRTRPPFWRRSRSSTTARRRASRRNSSCRGTRGTPRR
jgi:excinuclease ABC subunit C